jgi:threonine dehydrogenase-like Zn-dependent dehydrogenase
MVLGHEVAGIVQDGKKERRVAILAYKSCGECAHCRAGQENLCGATEHLGHSAGWQDMRYNPGGMAEEFEIWRGFEYDIPDSISFDEAIFLDGLGVAIHAVDQAGVPQSGRVGVIGLGPIGLMAAQVTAARGAAEVLGCDIDPLPVALAKEVGIEHVLQGDAGAFREFVNKQTGELDAVIDTVGTEASFEAGLASLAKPGALVLLAVHEHPVQLRPVALSGERRILTSANSMYTDFPRAIRMLAEKQVQVAPLITHRFHLTDAPKAFELVLNKRESGAYKIVLHP